MPRTRTETRTDTTVSVRRDTKRLLIALKAVMNARSYDEVIMALVERLPEDVKTKIKALLEARA